MNTRLLRRVQKKILAEPKSFDMQNWKNETECGTELCIGGWAYALHNKVSPEEASWHDINEEAEGILDLIYEESDVLFHAPAWPEKFRVPYYKAQGSHSHKRMAHWASKFIDWFIDRKKRGLSVYVE